MTESVAAFKFIISEREKNPQARGLIWKTMTRIMLIFLRTPGSRLHFLRCPVTSMPCPRRSGGADRVAKKALNLISCRRLYVLLFRFLPQEAEMLSLIRVWMSHEQGLPEP